MFTTSEQYRKEFRLTSLSEVVKVVTAMDSIVVDGIFHHYDTTLSLGPTITNQLVNAFLVEDESMTINTYLKITEGLEIPMRRELRANPKAVVAEYHKANRRFSRVMNLKRALSKKAPLFVTYNPLNKMYPRVTEKVRNAFYEFATIADYVAKGTLEFKDKHQQFITFQLPRVLPDVQDIKKVVYTPSESVKATFKDYESVALVQLIKTFADEDGAIDSLKKASNLTILLQDGVNFIHLPVTPFMKLIERKEGNAIIDIFFDCITALSELRPEAVESTEVEVSVDTEVSLDMAPAKIAGALMKKGVITEKEYGKHMELSKTINTIEAFDGNATVADSLKVYHEKDKSFKLTPLPEMRGTGKVKITAGKAELDYRYITEHLENDLTATMVGVQRGPFAVTNLTREEKRDAGSHSAVYRLTTKALKGGTGTAVMEFPVVKPDGVFSMGGVKYRMAVQRVTFPIAKIGPNLVSMQSAVSKIFLSCGDKKVNDYPGWIVKNILALADDGSVKDLKLSKHKLPIDPNLDIPMLFAAVAAKIETFTSGDIKFAFNKDSLEVTSGDSVKCGSVGSAPVFIDENGVLTKGEGAKAEVLGTLAGVLGLNETKAPKMFAELKIKGKQIPVGPLLAYWLGFTNSLKYLGIDYEVADLKRRDVGSEFSIKLSDVKVVMRPKNMTERLLVEGWHYFRNELAELKLEDLDSPSNYVVLFTPKGITRSHNIEYDIMLNMWVDLGTADLIRPRGYPTEMIPLLVHCVGLLRNRQHHEENDGAIMVERGYSRFNDIAHNELVKGVRDFYRNPNPNRKLTINPESVKMAILMDESVSPIEQTNPHAVMNEQGRIVYGGNMGRSNQSIVGRHRVYHKNNKGRISEAYTDDGKAGAVMFYSTNPEIASFNGLPNTNPELDPGTLLSFSYQYSPFVTFDDGKRGSFNRIQSNAMRACNGATIPPVMTNAGLSVVHRTGRVYGFAALKDGKITDIAEDGMTVEYSDKTTDTYPLGYEFGSASGKTYPRDLVTDRKKGYKFAKGEVLAWDRYHLFRDRYNPTQVNMYNGAWDITVFRERAGTYEDASRMSAVSAQKTASDIVHIHPVTVKYDDNLELLVKIGDEIEQDNPLAYITPEGVDISKAADPSSLDYFSAGSPKAKYSGKVMKIEAYYCGDPKEATPAIQKVIKASDLRLKRRAEFEDIHPNGEFTEPTFIQKQELSKQSAVILIYVLHTEVTVGGDKVANANSLKSVPGKVYDTVYTLSDGTPIDSDFSFNGQKARITPGAEYLGLLALNIRQIGLNGCKAYRK